MRFALATIFTLAIRALAVPSAPEAPKPSSSPQPNAPQNRDTSCTYSCPRGVIAPASFDLHSSHDFYSGLLCSYTGPRDSGLSCAFSVVSRLMILLPWVLMLLTIGGWWFACIPRCTVPSRGTQGMCTPQRPAGDICYLSTKNGAATRGKKGDEGSDDYFEGPGDDGEKGATGQDEGNPDKESVSMHGQSWTFGRHKDTACLEQLLEDCNSMSADEDFIIHCHVSYQTYTISLNNRTCSLTERGDDSGRSTLHQE